MKSGAPGGGRLSDKATPPKKVPYRVRLAKDRSVRWCSCGLSQRQPYCDESHRGTDQKPVMYKSDADLTVALCGCKLTQRPPFCDGNHIKLTDKS